MGIPRFNSAQEALDYYLDKYPNVKWQLDKIGITNPPVTILPTEYDNVPYNTVFNFQTINTVGEYREAVNKFNGNGYNDDTQLGW